MIKNSIWARYVWKTESFIAHALCLLNVLCVCVPNNHPTERITTCARIANLHRIWQNMSRSIYTVLFGSIRTFHFFVISFNRSLSRSHVVSIVSKKPFFSNFLFIHRLWWVLFLTVQCMCNPHIIRHWNAFSKNR